MSNVSYNIFPVSFEKSDIWTSLSCRHREVFRMIYSKCVFSDSYQYKSFLLSRGEVVIVLSNFVEQFNENHVKEDHIKKTTLHDIINKFIKIGIISKRIACPTERKIMILTIIQSECYELLKIKDRTKNSTDRTMSERKIPSSTERIENSLNNVEDIPKEAFFKQEKTSSERIEKVLNNEIPNAHTRNTNKHLNLVRNTSDSDSLFKEKFSEVIDSKNVFSELLEKENLKWLKSLNLGSYAGTLVKWSQDYSRERLEEAYEESKKCDNPGAFINDFLKKDKISNKNIISQNKEFAQGYIQDYFPNISFSFSKNELKIGTKEISLNYHSDIFVDELIRILKNNQEKNVS